MNFSVVLLVALACLAVFASREHLHGPPNVDQILSNPALSETMRSAVRLRVSENVRENILKGISVSERKLSAKERNDAPPPVSHVKKHRGPFRFRNVIKSVGARSTHVPVIIDFEMVANRDMTLYEDATIKHLISWLGVFRIGGDAEFYYNTVLGLSQMALNLSLTAGNKLNGFFDSSGGSLIPWYDLFISKIACDLDFKQHDPNAQYGNIFGYPNWCVEGIKGVALVGNSSDALQEMLYNDYQWVILDNDFNNIGAACVHPESPELTGDASYYWYCFLFFVKLSDDIDNDNCQCVKEGCCPSGYGL